MMRCRLRTTCGAYLPYDGRLPDATRRRFALSPARAILIPVAAEGLPPVARMFENRRVLAMIHGPVAQQVRAPLCRRGGRRFEAGRGRYRNAVRRIVIRRWVTVGRSVHGRSAPARACRTSCTPFYGPVAQSVRAPPCHGGGRRFKSGRGRVVAYILKVGCSLVRMGGGRHREWSLLFIRSVESQPENR